MRNTESLEIISEVLENERREVVLFRRLADTVRSPLGKAVFKDYAEKGKTLCTRVEALRGAIVKGPDGTAEARTFSTVADYDELDDDEGRLSRSIEDALAGFDDLTAIDVAVRFVRKTTRILARSCSLIRDPAHREALRAIETAERENFMHLKNIEEYLKDPHSWFREMEHHHMDGA
jgi:hypothetical protein